jgi:hypothetical protein
MMIEFFTILVIEYEVQGTPLQADIIFETWDHCEQALRIEKLYDVFYDRYENTSMRCYETGVMSQSLRPKLRPE